MKTDRTLKEWHSTPQKIRECVADLKRDDLEVRGGAEGWSIAEYIHHLVEANFIAAHVVLNALGGQGATYDWSWITPDRDWMRRLGYDRAPIEPALALHESLAHHIASLLALKPRGLRRSIAILDSPGGRPRTTTVAKILGDEVTHVSHHLEEIESIRRKLRVAKHLKGKRDLKGARHDESTDLQNAKLISR